MQKESLSLFSRGAKKNWLAACPERRKIRMSQWKYLSRCRLHSLGSVAVEECFYLDFSLAHGAVAEMFIYIFATVSLLPQSPGPVPGPPFLASLFSAVQASALNLPVERHTYTWTKWSSSSNSNKNNNKRRAEAIERNENNYETSKAEPSQVPSQSSPSPTRSHCLEAVQQVWLRFGAQSKCSGHYICYRFRLSDKMIIKMLLRLHLLGGTSLCWAASHEFTLRILIATWHSYVGLGLAKNHLLLCERAATLG